MNAWVSVATDDLEYIYETSEHSDDDLEHIDDTERMYDTFDWGIVVQDHSDDEVKPSDDDMPQAEHIYERAERRRATG